MKSKHRLRNLIPNFLPALVCIAVLIFAPPGLVTATVVVFLQIAIASQLATRITKRQSWSVHSVAVSFGIFLSITSLILLPLQAIGIPVLTWYVIPILGLLHSIRRIFHEQDVSNSSRDHWSLWIIAGATVFALAVLNRAQFLKYGPPWSLDPSVSHFDITGLQLLVNASITEGAGSNGYMSDWPLHYHWLALAWSGEIERNFQLEPFTALLFLLPWLSLVGLVITVTSLTSLMTRALWIRILVPFTTLSGQLPGTFASVNINWDSVSQMASGVLLLSGILILLHLRTQMERKWTVLLLLGLISCAIVGFKISASVIFVAGVIGVLVFHRDIRSRFREFTAPTLAAVFAGSIGGYFIFIYGVSSSAELVFRQWNSAIFADASTSGSAVILLASLLIASPLLLGRAAITSRSRDGVNAASAALLVSLLPIVLLEYTPPNSTWFFATACLLAIPASFVVAKDYYRKHTQSLLSTAVLLSLLSVVIWIASSATDWPVALRQVGLLAFLWFGALLISYITRRRGRSSTSGLAFLAGILVIAWITPAEMLTSRLAQTNESTDLSNSSAEPRDENSDGTSPSNDGAGVEVPPTTATHPIEEGTLVIVPAEIGFDALTWAAQNRLRVYYSYERYANLYGGSGTEAELIRRIRTADSWLNQMDRASLNELCDDGVEAVVTRSKSEDSSEAFTLASLPCKDAR